MYFMYPEKRGEQLLGCEKLVGHHGVAVHMGKQHMLLSEAR